MDPATALTARPSPHWSSIGLGAAVLLFVATPLVARAAVPPPEARAAQFRSDIQPILAQYCYDCHADGANKGNVAFDELKTDDALVRNPELWWKALKNVRAGLMPPAKKPQPTADERLRLAKWIKYGAFGIDPDAPDPGRVTLRRLNRAEYRNTIRDLMGVDFRADEEFPPDDTGYGFDTIADVLTVSPLLLEKYMQAAEAVVAASVPTVEWEPVETTIAGADFRPTGDNSGADPTTRAARPDRTRPGQGGPPSGASMTFYKEAKVASHFKAQLAGTYHVTVELQVKGAFDFDPGRCNFAFRIDDKDRLSEEFQWQDGKKYKYDYDEQWEPGEHALAFELKPLVPPEQRKTSVDMRILSVQVRGPMEREHWVRPKNFERFFTRDVPTDPAERKVYAREVLARFASRAFRRPADDRTVDRLLAIAEEAYSRPGKKFEEGIGQAIVAVLASPRFVFRVEAPAPGTTEGAMYAPVDEYALASRLSYFLWSTMPDDELLDLAKRGELRKNLPAQVKRMLADSRSEALVQNFVGQWLQVRDVEGIAIDARLVLARDNGQEKELQKELEDFRARIAAAQAQQQSGAQANAGGRAGAQTRPAAGAAAGTGAGAGTAVAGAQGAVQGQPNRQRFNRPRLFAKPAVELDEPLRLAMRRETEMFFGYILHEDRSILDLIDSDYTFLNERLAKHYGVPGVTGEQMRRVELPKDSPRGGVLTQGTVLTVTSNPTRTSPVKRGLFILDSIVGTPTLPPPADIPQLEESEKAFKDHEPSTREILEVHRSKALCSSCHSRMDPLGLGFENFNALGMWRERERNQPIDAAGKLATGETFTSVRELKQILRGPRKTDFYRCLTEKMLTYALGRGLEYYDVETVDQIVDRLEADDGRFSALLTGVIESAPFQQRRVK
jgi:Protein of unknown function (DUF1588)/Protein of unknown function (DUF1587)/Protein of unknown function (DUF1592)/Protein of unknown function (DUF1585)/Protein of unknown function (DUF1595)